MIDTNLNLVDFSYVEKSLSDKIGTPIKLYVSIGVNRHKEDIFKVQSQELKDKMGIMSSHYDTIKVTDFGGAFRTDPAIPYYWLLLHYTWTYSHNRGSNGLELATLWYHFSTKTWTIKFADGQTDVQPVK
jgi:hypothetical protein